MADPTGSLRPGQKDLKSSEFYLLKGLLSTFAKSTAEESNVMEALLRAHRNKGAVAPQPAIRFARWIFPFQLILCG